MEEGGSGRRNRRTPLEATTELEERIQRDITRGQQTWKNPKRAAAAAAITAEPQMQGDDCSVEIIEVFNQDEENDSEDEEEKNQECVDRNPVARENSSASANSNSNGGDDDADEYHTQDDDDDDKDDDEEFCTSGRNLAINDVLRAKTKR